MSAHGAPAAASQASKAASQVVLMVKDPPVNAGDIRDTSSILGKIPWSRKWQPAPVFLPGKFHEQRKLAGYSPWDCKESATTEHAYMQLTLKNFFFILFVFSRFGVMNMYRFCNKEENKLIFLNLRTYCHSPEPLKLTPKFIHLLLICFQLC